MYKIFFLLLACISLFANEYSDMGKEVGTQTRNHFKNDFEGTIAKPMTSESNFKTVDGTKEFKANLTCNEQSKSYLSMSYSGASDITLNVSLDKNVDGTKESSYSFSGISGVATNGVIKCNANSWEDCKYFNWELNTSGDLQLKEVTRYDVGGAYCINSSCLNVAQNSPVTVLDTLGGAIAGVYQSYKRDFLITKTNNTGSLIEFYGQNFNECSNFDSSQTPPTYQPTDESSLNTDTLMATQSLDPLSPYSIMQDSISNQNNNNSLKECEIKNDLNLDSNSYTVTTKIQETRQIGFGDAYYCNSTGWRIDAGNCKSGRWADCEAKLDSLTYAVDYSYDALGYYDADTPWTSDGHSWGGHASTYAGDGCAITTTEVIIEEEARHIQTNTCSVLEDDENCQLEEEIQFDSQENGVYSVKNFNVTGAKVEPSFKEFTGFYTWTVGMDGNAVSYYNSEDESGFIDTNDLDNLFFKVQRKYQCSSGENFDLSYVKTVNDSVDDSLTLNDDYTFSYSSQQENSDGSWSLQAQSGKLNIDFANEEAKYCEIKWLDTNSDVMSDGSTKHNTSGELTTWSNEIRECTDDYAVCPYDSSKGETIKHPCGQINNFAEVASTLMAIDEASNDLICSGN